MGLILVPATRENLEKSIEKSVNIDFASKYLPTEFLRELIKFSGNEGIRCWAMTKNKERLFESMNLGDEVLLSEKRSGKFTHYGIIIGKINNVEFGNALWPFVGKNPWENIYFLANITRVNLSKKDTVVKLGYKSTFEVPGPIKVKDKNLIVLDTISKRYEIPIYDNVGEVNEEKSYYGEEIKSNGKRRKGHNKFSREVKENYNYSCAICDISEPEFLIAGHITPWSEDSENRLNPQNGICLCSLHDKAFEHGYIGLKNDFTIFINPRLNERSKLFQILREFGGEKLKLPTSNPPAEQFLKNHRKKHNLE